MMSSYDRNQTSRNKQVIIDSYNYSLHLKFKSFNILIKKTEYILFISMICCIYEEHCFQARYHNGMHPGAMGGCNWWPAAGPMGRPYSAGMYPMSRHDSMHMGYDYHMGGQQVGK